MDSDDGCSIGTASTDTSMFLRELQALNTEGNTGPIAVNQSITYGSLKTLGSGEGENPETLPQAMMTLRGEQAPQIVNLSDQSDEGSVGIYGRQVEVFVPPVSSSQEKAPGSNKVKITPMVNHMWEHRFYHGNLVAVHQDSDFMAYVLKGKSGGNVRVVSRRTAARNLLKCFNGNVMDIAFALSEDIVLAAADETGSLFIHSFTMEGDNILSTLILHIERETYEIESSFRNQTRVIWCPYMPDDEADSSGNVDVAKMLVLLHGTQAEVWNVDYVSKEHGIGPLTSNSLGAGVMCIEAYEPMMPVVNAAFAPDGSAIAVAYHSGLVKFFLVDLDGDGESGCMHEWNPHDGSPVTSLFFLDDHRHTSPDQQLWKFALTGANYNTEIKIWSCESWACVQVLRFNAPMSTPEMTITLKSEIDLTSKYFVLSDINAKMLYILHLNQDTIHATAHISSVSKFSLAQPCVSFAVYDASLKRINRAASDSHLDDITTGELEENGDMAQNGEEKGIDGDNVCLSVQIKMYAVHTKSLQEYLIRYRPETSAPPLPTVHSVSSVSQDETGIRDMLSDVSLDQTQNSIDTPRTPHDPTLVQPSSSPFSNSSPSVPVPSSDVNRMTSPIESNLISASSSTSSFTHVTAMNDDMAESPLSSVDHGSSIMSPSSLFSQTPQKPSANHSGNPLPAISSCDDEDSQSSQKNSPASVRSVTKDVSPRLSLVDEHKDTVPSPNRSLDSTGHSKLSQDPIDEMFNSSWQHSGKRVGAGDSIESGTSSVKMDDKYDEDDQEVAQTLGSTLVSEGFGGPQGETIEGLNEEEDDDDEEEEEESVREIDLEDEVRKEAKWPDPPDVSKEAKRLVTEAIKRSAEEEGKSANYDEDDEAEIEEILPDELNANVNAFTQAAQKIPQALRMPAGAMVSEEAFNSLEGKLSDLTSRMIQQQDLMLALQKEVASQREVQIQLHRQQMEQQQLKQVASQQPSIQEDISKLEDILVSRMEHSLAQHMHKETQRLQDSLSRSDHQRLARDKELQAGLVGEIGRTMRDTLTNTLRSEIKQTVNPTLHKLVEPMKDKIHQEVAQRLTACDSLLRDNIAKAVKSRSTMDVLANSVGDVIYQQMQNAYTHTFKSSMLPSFSSAMEKTVRDVNAVFQQGTKEYQLYLKQTTESTMKDLSKMEELVKRMEASQYQFNQSVSHMQNVMLTAVKTELGGQVANAVASVKDAIVSEVYNLVKEEVSTAMKDQGEIMNDKLTTYLRSAAATPVPVVQEDGKERILRELHNNRFDEAFQSALSAENLDLVLYVCEVVGPMDLFSQSPCPLSQPVLLSLISQLATNLDHMFDTKMRFLSDAVMNLDTTNPRTSEHVPAVLTSLVQYLNAALAAFSSDPAKVKVIRMLIMAARSLVSMKV